MHNPQDEEMLQRILGKTEIPQDVEMEYALRARMYHCAGHSGPLGGAMLVDLVRHLGYSRQLEPAKPEAIEWRRLPQDGSVRVEAKFFGEWQPGVFLGFVAAGTLAVKLDDDPAVKECYPHVVRLSDLPLPAPTDNLSVGRDEDGPDARAELLDDEPDTETIEPEDDEAFDWSLAQPGDPVWVDDDEIKDGVLVSAVESEGVIVGLRVQVDGVEKDWPLNQVTYAK